jgi:photosystem II stability/assembly factor-like uncharacterized protein
MNNSIAFRTLALLLVFSALFVVSSGNVIAQATRMPVQSVASLPEKLPGPVSGSSAVDDPVSSPARLQDGQQAALAPTTSYTVTLGAWRNLRPTESPLRSVSMLPASYSVNCTDPDQKSKGWAVGDGGVILNYCSGVWDHAISVESLPTNLWGVQAISPTLAVAVGGQGTVLMYLWDRVANDWVWTKSPIPVGNETLYSVSMVPDGMGNYTGWAVGSNGTLVRGTISPAVINGHPTHTYTWQNVTADYPSLPSVDYYFGLQMLSPTNGWVSGGRYSGTGVILHWDGNTWSVFQQINGYFLHGLYMTSPTDGWVVGSSGVIYHYNGSTWSQAPSPTTALLVRVSFNASGEGWITGFNGTLARYSGGTWSLFTDLRTDPFDFYGIDFASGHGWIVAFHSSKPTEYGYPMGGQILEYENGLWLAVTPATDNRLNAVSVVSDGNAWAVGAADSLGGTIIHWDGKHWQRWYQRDLPIPAVDLYAIDMVSATDGWAAGDPPAPGAPAVFLHWDGRRWAPLRYNAPVNVRVNSLDMLGAPYFGWAVADTGNAVAKYDSLSGYWSANHTCQGPYYQLRSTSIVTANNIFGWDAWAVGTRQTSPPYEFWLRYMGGCSSGYAWDAYQTPVACAPVPNPDDGPTATILRGIKMVPGLSGYAVGNYQNRASIYKYNDGIGWWNTYWCYPRDDLHNPTRFYSVDIVKASGIAWIGGFYTEVGTGRKVAYIAYDDALGFGWGSIPFPVNGVNIYHRPILSLRMSSDTMGWAVGDSESPNKLSVIYQYPYPNFTLDIQPPSRAVMPGQSTTYTVSVNSLGGFTATVSLDLWNWVSGVTYSLTPNMADAQTASTIRITTSVTTPLGVYDIPLLGTSVFRSGDNDVPVQRLFYLRLTVTDHPVYAVNPTHGPAGTLVTLSGANFGPDPGVGNRSTATNHVILAGQQMPDANVLSWSNSQITVQVPNSAVLFPQGPILDFVSVTTGGNPSNADFSFQLENHLTSVSSRIGSGVITATVVGTGLGTDPGSLFRSTDYEHVTLNGAWIPNADVKSWGYNVITFTVPLTTPSGSLSVTSNGFESNALAFTSGFKVYLPVVIKQ